MPGRPGPLRKFFRTPKGLLILILAALIGVAAPVEGVRVVAPGLLSAIAGAGLIDFAILRIRHKRWEVPSGAILTAIVGSVATVKDAGALVAGPHTLVTTTS